MRSGCAPSAVATADETSDDVGGSRIGVTFVMPAAFMVGMMTLFMTLVPCVSEVAMTAALFTPNVCAA